MQLLVSDAQIDSEGQFSFAGQVIDPAEAEGLPCPAIRLDGWIQVLKTTTYANGRLEVTAQPVTRTDTLRIRWAGYRDVVVSVHDVLRAEKHAVPESAEECPDRRPY